MTFLRLTALALLLLSGLATLHAQKAPYQKPKRATIGSNPSPAASRARGEHVYRNVCLTCHQADGLGVPNLNPPLAKTQYVLGDKARLVRIVLAGLAEPVEIDGETYSQHMPPQAYLTDQQVADVLTYVRSSFGNKASAVAVGEVSAGRAALGK